VKAGTAKAFRLWFGELLISCPANRQKTVS